jgi:phenylalanine-4-hydroxylase
LWESFACHDPKVAKLPLTAAAGDMDYDVTRPQPQLFVTPSFEALHDVLDAVVRELPSVQGGEAALAEALAASEVATITLEGGVELHGVLRSRVLSGNSSSLLEVAGRAQLGAVRVAANVVRVVLGDARAAIAGLRGSAVDWELPGGMRLTGELREAHADHARGVALLVLESGKLLAGPHSAELRAGDVLVLATAVLGAHAGAPSDFFTETELPRTKVPKPRAIPPREHALLGLYEAAISALRSSLGSEVLPVFERVHRELAAQFPEDWLLRWNLLESLQKLGLPGPMADDLRRELSELEVHFQYRQPIASGLAYLARVAQAKRGT